MIDDESVWKLLKKEFEQDSGLQAGPVPLGDIDNAEVELKVKFSSSYRKFIRSFGGAIVGPYKIVGLRRQENMDVYLWSVKSLTHFFKKEQNWPNIESWYIISDDGFGNPIGIDPEGKVWLSDHDSGFEQIKLADSFEEFLYKLYTDTLYE
jgi:hypothetical protein